MSLTALSGVPFIAFDREAPTRKALDRLFREKNLDLNPVMEMDNVETIKRAVEMGLGVAILPLSTCQAEVSGRHAGGQALRRGARVAPHRPAHPQGQVPGPRLRGGARGLQGGRADRGVASAYLPGKRRFVPYMAELSATRADVRTAC